MYQGEGVRIEATRASVTAAGGPGPFLQNVVVPESLGNGIATVRLKDVDLHFLTSKDEKTIRNMHLDVTGQRVEVSEIGGCQVLGLKHGEILRHVAAKHLAPIASMTPSVIGNIARRAADGLRFFWKLGKAVALSPQWYARDTEAKGAKGKATTHASVAPSQLLDGFKQFWGCKMIIKGISSVLWYLGLKRAVAAVHLEDLHGESAFLLLKGNCKIWIAIPPRFTPKLLRCLEESGGRELVSALYEKRLLIPLCTLDNWEIPYSSATQAPGDLVITSGIHEVSAVGTKMRPLAVGHVDR